jgi:hypothetical protein
MNSQIFSFNSDDVNSFQTTGTPISSDYSFEHGNIMPERFNTIGESGNFPISSIGKSHQFTSGREIVEELLVVEEHNVE